MGKKLIIKGADFSEHGIKSALVFGTPNTQISFKLNGSSVVMGTTDSGGYLELQDLDSYAANVTNLNNLTEPSASDIEKVILIWDLTNVTTVGNAIKGHKIKYFDMSGCKPGTSAINFNSLSSQNDGIEKVDLSGLYIDTFGDSFWQSGIKEVILKNCTFRSASFLGDYAFQSSPLEKVDMRGCSSSSISYVKTFLNEKQIGGVSTWDEYTTGVLTKS